MLTAHTTSVPLRI